MSKVIVRLLFPHLGVALVSAVIIVGGLYAVLH